MGLCNSRPVGSEASSAAADLHGAATPAPGAGQPAKQVVAKVPPVPGADQHLLLGTDSGYQDGSTTTTLVQYFTEQDSSSLLEPHTSTQANGGPGSAATARFLKRASQPQPNPHARQSGGTVSDTAMLLGRSNGIATQTSGPATVGTTSPQAAAAAAATATAATAAAAAATAANGTVSNGVYAVVPIGLPATGPGAVAAWRPYPPVISRSDAVVQTDAALLYPLLRDPGPTVPVRWRKGEGIGSGSFGQVYLALNCDTGELLAVKEVPAGLVELGAGGAGGGGPGGGGPGGGGRSSAAEAVAQLEREVALLSQLRHPNIVRYVGTQRSGAAAMAGAASGGAGAPLYIFLEYVPGGSLSSQLSRFGPLPEPLVALYTRQLLLGLAYLHAQRTVHRDVKGANLLLEKTGVLKLADFGMAKQLMEQVSFTRSFKGSAYWMAPEVIKQQGYGVQADIWSVGCTVLEMATGKPPWSQCTSQVQAIFKIASSPDLPAIPEHLSPQASEFILLCLQRDSAARPTAEELLRHPFVTGPLAANPLPPALADPLASLYDSSSALRSMPSVAAVSGVRANGSMTLLGPGAAAAAAAASGGGAGLGFVPGLNAGSSLAMAMNLTPLRLGSGQTASGGATPGRVGSVATTPATAAAAAGAAWTPFGGLMLNPSAAAATAAVAAAAAAGTTPAAAAAVAASSGGTFALGLQSPYGTSTASGAAGGSGTDILCGGGTGGAMSEDHLAALVLGNSVHISKAARAAQVMAADEEREVDDDTHIDFTTQPQLFRVRGLLTLPPLKMLHAQQLPPLTVQTQTVRHEAYSGVGASGGAGDVIRV